MTKQILISAPMHLACAFEARAAKINRDKNPNTRIYISGFEYPGTDGQARILASSKSFAHDTVLDKLRDQGYSILSY